MDPQSSSHAAASSWSSLQTAGGRRRHGSEDSNDDEHALDGSRDRVHPLRTSLSPSDAGSLSLHASRRLQSTPRGKAATAGAALHRVYRAARPVTASSSATESSETGTLGSSSVSLSSADEADEADHNNKCDSSRSDLHVRDYWQRVIVDIQDSDALADVSQMPRPASQQQYLAAQAPSTGSSTLVEQEAEAGQGKADTLDRPTSISAARPAGSPRMSLTPPGQTSSRFASAVTYAEQEQEERERSMSSSSVAERSITPQQQSYRSTAQSSALEDSQSLAASRVHDIFQRHIHNASTSYSSRRLSGNTTLRNSTNAGSRPRQRLRDLLSSSEIDLERSNGARGERPLRVSDQQAPLREYQPLEGSSAYGFKPQRTSPRQRSSVTRLEESRPAGSSRSLHIVQRTQIPGELVSGSRSDGRDMASSLQQISVFQQAYERQEEGSPRQSSSAQPRLSSETEGETDNDGDVEDHHIEEPRPLLNSASRTDRSYTQPHRRWSRQQRDLQSAEEEDSLPSLPDVPSDEDEEPASPHLLPMHATSSFKSYTTAETPAKQSYQVMVDSRSPSNRPSTPSGNLGVPVSPSPRRTARHNHLLFRNDSYPKTPPKTPRFPGHYLSTTPFQPEIATATDLHTTSRLVTTTPLPPTGHANDVTLATPFVPGGYTSPFPHPRALSRDPASPVAVPSPPRKLTDVIDDEKTTRDRRSRDRFSSMLHRVIQEARSEDAMPFEPRLASSRSNDTPDNPNVDGNNLPARASAGRLTAASGDVNVESQQDRENTSTTNLTAAEGTLQSLLVDIMKPLKGLMGGLAPVETSVEQTAMTSAPFGDSADVPVTHQSAEQPVPDRRKRRSEQDAMLRQLQEADLLDQSLASKAEELRLTLEDMSNKFTTQVSSVLNETFAKENRKRKLWFAFLIFAECALLWALWSFANARANLLYQTTYYDPFFPDLYAAAPSPHVPDLYGSSSLASIPSTSTQFGGPTSNFFIESLTSYFRTSSFSFSRLLPTDPTISGYDMSLGSRLDTLGQHGFVSYVYQFIGIFRHMYTQLLSLGLGTPSFVHGTLGDVVGNSGSPAWNHRSSQLYRVPT